MSTIIAGSGTAITFPDGTTQTTAATSTFPTGTVVLFYQSAAPTGWTQVTSLNDYSLRLVSGAGGTTGGTTAFSTVFANQTPTITVGATTLSTSQIPSHTHSYSITNVNNQAATYVPCSFAGVSYSNSGTTATNTGAQGGGTSHTHSGSSSAITLNVLYANVIICSKN